MSDRPQVEQELAERLASSMYRMTGFDFLSIVYMISSEATQAAVKEIGTNLSDTGQQGLVEAVTDAVNEWMNVQKDFILGFEDGPTAPQMIQDAAERAGIDLT